MESLGLKPTKGSGSGWIEKEDGQNEYIICQLKSTDAESIKIKKLDIEKLEHNATVSHKIPLFVIEFLKTNELYFLVSPMDVQYIADYIKCGKTTCDTEPIIPDIKSTNSEKPKIKSSKNARENFWKQKQKLWENRR